jgi:hypothetical protein
MANIKLPDGPQSPTLLQLLRWIARPLEFMETSANRYGDMLYSSVG